MSVKNIVLAIPLTSFNSAALAAGYAPINAAGFPEPLFLVRLINNSNADVTISYDGVNDADFVPHGTQLQLNFQTNGQPNNFNALLAKGTVVYVKGAAGAGLIYLAGYYQPQGA